LGGLAAVALPHLKVEEKKVTPPALRIDRSSFELEETSISELADGMSSGNIPHDPLQKNIWPALKQSTVKVQHSGV